MRYFKTGIVLTMIAAGSAGNALAQTTYGQPYVNDFSPASGPPGTVITLTGSGFTGNNAAWVGTAHDAAYTVISDSQMTVTVPADGTTGQIALFNPQHAAWTGWAFTVTAATSGATTGTGSGTTTSGAGTTGTSTTAGTASRTSTVASAAPTVSLSASNTVITAGQSSTLTWSSTNATQCSGVSTKRSGTRSVAPAKTTTYTETCSNTAGSKNASVTVTVNAAVTTPAPTVTLTAAATALTAGQSTTLSWTSGNATSCSGAGTGTSGSATVTPATTTTYTETCAGAGGSQSASTTVTVTAATAAALSVRVSGNHFIDGAGRALQLRGVNLSGLEFVAVQGWSPANPWGGQTGTATPDFNAVKSWGTNAVRIPLNEASWLGLTCNDTVGNVLHADPGSNYQSTVQQTVQNATAAGLYVILDLHWTAPGSSCPLLQTQMADADHSLSFWSQVAGAYKGYPNVLFELFNEPYFNFEFSGSVWPYLMLGSSGTFTGYPASSNSGSWQDIKANWAIASMQAMLNTVRATGATNVVLIGSDGYTQDLSGWVATHPTDPLGQMGATWHAYPTYGAALGSAADALPNFGTQAYTWAQNILTAGFPVVVTEYGDHNAAGTVGAPMAQSLLEWADPRAVSYFGWTWDVWGINDNDLIKDATGTPTDGFGVYVKAHYLCAATGSTNCP